MAKAVGQGEKLNVFIAYSRDDIDFADQLNAALQVGGFETSIDRRDISPGDDWKERLRALIRDADTILFVLSPSSARSDIAAWEVEEAVHLGKRIIPVLCRSLEDASPQPPLAKLNYIFFYPEPRAPGSGFGSGLVRLASALNTDFDWQREHTRYLQRAAEWDAGGRPANRLLTGDDIAGAKAWAAYRPKAAPGLTELQLDFIKASEDEAVRQQGAETHRLRVIEQAIAERDTALARLAEAERQLGWSSKEGEHFERRGSEVVTEALREPEKQEVARSVGQRSRASKSEATTAMLGGIFICYRRGDSGGYAGRIYDRLAIRLGRKNVFIDVDNIPFGLDFVDVLSERVGACGVLIAVIGKDWISSIDKNNRRRLDDHNDFVRIEIEAALQRNVRVIPVLVDGATMPGRQDLPESLKCFLDGRGSKYLIRVLIPTLES